MEILKNRYNQIIILLLIFFLLIIGKNILPEWLFRPPSFLILPVVDWFNAFFTFLLETLHLKSATRAVAAAIQWLLNIVQNILLGGHKGLRLPALPWTAVLSIITVIAFSLMGWRMALFTAISVVYLAVFGQWIDAMQTLSLVLVTVPLSVILGLSLGVLSYKNRLVKKILAPLLNVAQSLPHFSYLIPVVVFFGIGHHAGIIATVIFATPPMIRLTLLGLGRVPPEIIESGYMSGCNNWQLLTRVLIPSAKPDIMIGVNQVIMQCLAMVVIASFIGAPGLGYKVLIMLNNLRIGKALELGVSIVIIAIILDRLSLAWAGKQPDYTENLPFYLRYKYPLIIFGLVFLSILCSLFLPIAYKIPREFTITTEPYWDAGVFWIAEHWFDGLQAFREFLSLKVLIPMRDAYLSLPIFAVVVLVVGIGIILGGLRSASTVFFYLFFIIVSGWWDRSMITAYLVSFAVFVCVGVGVPLGILASRVKWLQKFILTLCDTFQTFPSFIYLIPVIMLFQVNDVSAAFAVIVYATIPITRYTIEGLRNIPMELQESVTMSGANKLQKLTQLELPMAFPHIMLGINQTVLFALFMVIIAAFIGTQDLGQEIMKALAESDMGKGLVLGLCVAFIGLIVDHLINTWAVDKKAKLGLVN